MSARAEIPVIRSAHAADAPSIAELMAVLGYPSSVEQIEARIAAFAAFPDTVIFVAECASRVVGLLSFHCIPLFHADGFLGRITNLVVSQDFRRRGVGRLLVAAAEEFAWTHHCIRMELTSGDHRPDAHAFYERCGFQIESRRFVKPAPHA
jgi:GNAT superfamily N-acetyltransferase